MKKFRPIFVSGILLTLIFALAACAGEASDSQAVLTDVQNSTTLELMPALSPVDEYEIIEYERISYYYISFDLPSGWEFVRTNDGANVFFGDEGVGGLVFLPPRGLFTENMADVENLMLTAEWFLFVNSITTGLSGEDLDFEEVSVYRYRALVATYTTRITGSLHHGISLLIFGDEHYVILHLLGSGDNEEELGTRAWGLISSIRFEDSVTAIDERPPTHTPSASAESTPTPQPTTPTPQAEISTEEHNEIAISQSGWVAASSRDGYWVYYGFILHNHNYNAMRSPRIRITARSADGIVLGTRDSTLGAMHSGQSFADGGFISTDERPEIVEFEVLPARDRDWVNPASLRISEYVPLHAENVSISGNRVLGDIVNNSEHLIDRVTVTVVFRDAYGNMLAAASTTVRDVTANGSTPFNLSVWSPLAGAISTENFEVFVSARY